MIVCLVLIGVPRVATVLPLIISVEVVGVVVHPALAMSGGNVHWLKWLLCWSDHCLLGHLGIRVLGLKWGG